jgi:hypothetical protein
MIWPVTGVTAYHWYAGGQWHVMSPNGSTISTPYQCGTGSGEERGQMCGRFQQSRF